MPGPRRRSRCGAQRTRPVLRRASTCRSASTSWPTTRRFRRHQAARHRRGHRHAARRPTACFHARGDEASHELFTLSNLEPALFTADDMNGLVTHGLTLNLDVPCVMNGGAAFGSMVTAARQLAAGLNGDRGGRQPPAARRRRRWT
ncbi:MAG: cell division protein ZipA C-terminal FtsZ-binding domain-containing protein [Comamonadaceae bacterium]|nr:cell division protein ZipA C-terminal FtsZ-binding domain-containing protein [Comamonadaceae bacterium]